MSAQKRKSPTRLNKRNRELLLDAIRRGGNVTKACELIGCVTSAVYMLAQRDPDFATELEAARTVYLEGLADECIERAVDGDAWVLQRVVGGQVVEERRYRRRTSKDILRILERRLPGWRPGVDHDHQHHGPTGVLVVPGTAPSEEAWAAQFGGFTEDNDD
ncbi:MAG: hypothetical protein AAF648_16920 [Pseudomonadota bacterium]